MPSNTPTTTKRKSKTKNFLSLHPTVQHHPDHSLDTFYSSLKYSFHESPIISEALSKFWSDAHLLTSIHNSTLCPSLDSVLDSFIIVEDGCRSLSGDVVMRNLVIPAFAESTVGMFGFISPSLKSAVAHSDIDNTLPIHLSIALSTLLSTNSNTSTSTGPPLTQLQNHVNKFTFTLDKHYLHSIETHTDRFTSVNGMSVPGKLTDVSLLINARLLIALFGSSSSSAAVTATAAVQEVPFFSPTKVVTATVGAFGSGIKNVGMWALRKADLMDEEEDEIVVTREEKEASELSKSFISPLKKHVLNAVSRESNNDIKVKVDIVSSELAVKAGVCILDHVKDKGGQGVALFLDNISGKIEYSVQSYYRAVGAEKMKLKANSYNDEDDYDSDSDNGGVALYLSKITEIDALYITHLLLYADLASTSPPSSSSSSSSSPSSSKSQDQIIVIGQKCGKYDKDSKTHVNYIKDEDVAEFILDVSINSTQLIIIEHTVKINEIKRLAVKQKQSNDLKNAVINLKRSRVYEGEIGKLHQTLLTLDQLKTTIQSLQHARLTLDVFRQSKDVMVSIREEICGIDGVVDVMDGVKEENELSDLMGGLMVGVGGGMVDEEEMQKELEELENEIRNEKIEEKKNDKVEVKVKIDEKEKEKEDDDEEAYDTASGEEEEEEDEHEFSRVDKEFGKRTLLLSSPSPSTPVRVAVPS